VDNPYPLPLRDLQPSPAFSEFLANLTVPPYSPLWRKSQRVLRASLSALRIGSPVIWHTRNTVSSNKTLVSAAWFAQFSSGYIRGYDRHH